MKNLPSYILLAGVLATAATTAHAQSTWDGGASTLNWGDANNWNPDGIPGANTSVNFGTLASGLIINVGANRDIGSGTLTFQSGATSSIDLDGFRVRARNLNVQTGSGNHTIDAFGLTGAGTFTAADLSQVLTVGNYDSGGNHNITKSGNGTVQINAWGSGGVTRNTLTINGGTFDIRGNLGLGTGSAETMMLSGAGSTLTNGGATTVTYSFGQRTVATGSYSGSITGNANFALGATSTASNRDFSGVQTLSGNNTYTGTTVVNQGTLIISGTTSGQGNYTVRGTTGGTGAKTGTLLGTGTVGLSGSSTFTVGSTSHIAGSRGVLEVGTAVPDSIGALTIGTSGNSNSLVFTNNSTVEFDFNNTLNDQITVVGALTLGATDTRLSLDSLSFSSGLASYTLMTYSSISGTFSSVFLDGSDITSTALSGFLIGTDPDQYKLFYGSTALTLEVVPEPSVAALLLGAGALAMLLRRRRRVASTS